VSPKKNERRSIVDTTPARGTLPHNVERVTSSLNSNEKSRLKHSPVPSHIVKKVAMSEETLMIQRANEKLKSELLNLIDQMDT